MKQKESDVTIWELREWLDRNQLEDSWWIYPIKKKDGKLGSSKETLASIEMLQRTSTQLSVMHDSLAKHESWLTLKGEKPPSRDVTISELRDWVNRNQLEDSWWVSPIKKQDGSMGSSHETLASIEMLQRTLPQLSVMHVSVAKHENWLPLKPEKPPRLQRNLPPDSIQRKTKKTGRVRWWLIVWGILAALGCSRFNWDRWHLTDYGGVLLLLSQIQLIVIIIFLLVSKNLVETVIAVCLLGMGLWATVVTLGYYGN